MKLLKSEQCFAHQNNGRLSRQLEPTFQADVSLGNEARTTQVSFLSDAAGTAFIGKPTGGERDGA
jgi:hypothetical protein